MNKRKKNRILFIVAIIALIYYISYPATVALPENCEWVEDDISCNAPPPIECSVDNECGSCERCVDGECFYLDGCGGGDFVTCWDGSEALGPNACPTLSDSYMIWVVLIGVLLIFFILLMK